MCLATQNSTTGAIFATVATATLLGYLAGKVTECATKCMSCVALFASCCCLLPCAPILPAALSVGLHATIALVALPYLTPISTLAQIAYLTGVLISQIPTNSSRED